MLIDDPTELTCSPDLPLTSILQRLGEHPNLTLIVVDHGGRVLGTITDGDVRRAILAGAGVDSLASRIMKSSPAIGRAGKDKENETLLASVAATAPALPIVDAEGRLVAVLMARASSAFSDALVMAGGFGRRLKERTQDSPKPLLPVGGKPILEHILTRLEAAGTSRVHISVHYLADQFEKYVSERNNKAEIHVLYEESPLGTAGAITLLPEVGSKTVLLVNGDILTSLSFANLSDFHDSGRYDVTIAAATHEVNIPYGVLRFTDVGQFQGIDEKPTLSSFVAAGIYALSPKAQEIVPKGRAVDVPEMLSLAKNAGLHIGAFPVHEYWTDVGHPDDLDRADRLFDNGGAGSSVDATVTHQTNDEGEK